MAYANTLPIWTIKVCRWFNVSFLAINALICIDLFLLPRIYTQERIKSIEETHVTFTNILRRRVTMPLENVVIITENFRSPFKATAFIHLEQVDSVQIVSTRLFKIIEKSSIAAPSLDMKLHYESRIFSTLMFIPIAFAFVSIIGVVMWHNKEQLLNATVMNVFMFIMFLVLISYF
jgi:hypothetical protein